MPDDNPFAPGATAGSPFDEVDISPVPIEPEAVIRRCIDLIKAQPGLMIGACLLSVVPSFFLSSVRFVFDVGTEAEAFELAEAVSLGIVVGTWGLDFLVSTFLTLGLLRIFLHAVYGQPAHLSMLVGEVERYPAALATYVLVSLATTAGLVLLLVPGIIIAIAMAFAVHLQLDRNLGVLESLTASYELTDGHKGNLFGTMLLIGLVLGVLSCFTFGLASTLTPPLLTLVSVVLYQSVTHLAETKRWEAG